MKRFTVKDFIAYNNPCFSCGNKINFKLGFINSNIQDNNTSSYLRASILPEYTEIDLSISYFDSLKLFIFHKTNKILSNNNNALTKYLSSHKLFLSSTCSSCLTGIESQYLDINCSKQFINAVGISTEFLVVRDEKKIYSISSSFIENKSILIVDKLDRVIPLSPTILTLPLVPLFKLKNKENFLDKVKTYLLFS